MQYIKIFLADSSQIFRQKSFNKTYSFGLRLSHKAMPSSVLAVATNLGSTGLNITA